MAWRRRSSTFHPSSAPTACSASAFSDTSASPSPSTPPSSSSETYPDESEPSARYATGMPRAARKLAPAPHPEPTAIPAQHPPPTTQPPPASVNAAIALGFLIGFTSMAHRTGFGVLYPAMVLDRGWTASEITAAFSVGMLIYSPAAVLTGQLVDRVGV